MNEVDAKTKIMDVALSLFAEKGFDGTTTRDIAAAASLNISLISYYFGGKEGLYKAILENFAGHVKADMNKLIESFDKEDLSLEKIRDVIGAVVDRILDLRLTNPHIAQIMAREKLSGMPFSREIHEKMLFEVGEKLAGILKKGQRTGLVRKDLNPYFYMCLLSESVMGYILMHDCAQSLVERCYLIPKERSEFKKQVISIFTEGILK
ncbi:MAG: TetR family transcriptional regulator [Bdellovibrionia bacterium]